MYYRQVKRDAYEEDFCFDAEIYEKSFYRATKPGNLDECRWHIVLKAFQSDLLGIKKQLFVRHMQSGGYSSSSFDLNIVSYWFQMVRLQVHE